MLNGEWFLEVIAKNLNNKENTVRRMGDQDIRKDGVSMITRWANYPVDGDERGYTMIIFKGNEITGVYSMVFPWRFFCPTIWARQGFHWKIKHSLQKKTQICELWKIKFAKNWKISYHKSDSYTFLWVGVGFVVRERATLIGGLFLSFISTKFWSAKKHIKKAQK